MNNRIMKKQRPVLLWNFIKQVPAVLLLSFSHSFLSHFFWFADILALACTFIHKALIPTTHRHTRTQKPGYVWCLFGDFPLRRLHWALRRGFFPRAPYPLITLLCGVSSLLPEPWPLVFCAATETRWEGELVLWQGLIIRELLLKAFLIPKTS